MDVQTPAEGIALSKAWNDSKMFTILCDCGSDDHSATMWIEVVPDPDVNDVTTTFYVKTVTPWYSLNRFKQIWQLLTKGYLTQEACIILNQQSATNLAGAITQSVEELKRVNVDK
jgi:hypothetical protein